MKFFEFMFVPTILFLTVVMPIWLTMHYRSVNRSARGLNEEDRVTIEHMLETVDKLDDRILMYGSDGGRAWSAVLDRQNGRLSASVDDNGFAFLLFGNCTVP